MPQFSLIERKCLVSEEDSVPSWRVRRRVHFQGSNEVPNLFLATVPVSTVRTLCGSCSSTKTNLQATEVAYCTLGVCNTLLTMFRNEWTLASIGSRFTASVSIETRSQGALILNSWRVWKVALSADSPTCGQLISHPSIDFLLDKPKDGSTIPSE